MSAKTSRTARRAARRPAPLTDQERASYEEAMSATLELVEASKVAVRKLINLHHVSVNGITNLVAFTDPFVEATGDPGLLAAWDQAKAEARDIPTIEVPAALF